MKEIKFRAWYKGNKYPLDKNNLEDYEKPQMIYNVHKLYDGSLDKKDDPFGVTCGLSSFYSTIDNEDFEIMQYIGLKDVHNKEIYEGDIVKHYTHKTVSKITWSEKFCCFVGIPLDELCKDVYFFQKMDSKNLEVIGNIYENEK